MLFAATPAKEYTAQQRQYWAFQKVKSTRPPGGGALHPIDAFVIEKLKSKGLAPSPRAGKVTLIRRATFDLTGLPPTPDEVNAFLKDTSPQAFEKVIDRLLASPHYGERWARHWLDLARYAESNGFRGDEVRPNAWRYRDYAIHAFNADKPYDRFVREQIAGDELWPGDPQARIATAFNRQYPDESNAADLMHRRQEILHDVTDTVALVFMGLTVGCAKCHDHKFDPISQKDYYRLQAFFAATGEDDRIAIWSQDRVAEYNRKLAVWEEKTRHIRDQIAALGEETRATEFRFLMQKYPALVKSSILKPAAERNPYEALMAQKASNQTDRDPIGSAAKLKGAAGKRYKELSQQLKEFAPLHPGEFPVGSGVADIGAEAPPTHVLRLGIYDAKLDPVEPGFPSILDTSSPSIRLPGGAASTGRRSALANWLASPDNPLTARVMVNRIWQNHFGKGIVATPSDFGIMGQRPTHPELLDWLAAEFVREGWSIKKMHRLILTSATYQQSSDSRVDAVAADPFNRLLWRYAPQRLEGESIRDTALAVAGLLNPKMGGPGVMPPLPAEAANARWKASSKPDDPYRRSIYVFVRRSAPYPMLQVFDMPDTHETCDRRNVTTTAPQALAMINGQDTLEWAQAFAARVLKAAGANPSAQVEQAYTLAYNRPPTAWDKDTALTFVAQQKTTIADRAASGGKLALPSAIPEGVTPAEAAALVDFCHMLLNSNEFVYRR